MAVPDPFRELVATARRLQGPGGCPWDRVQTVTSLLPCLIEETWEVFEASRSGRGEELPEELGDVLYTALFLALILERQGGPSLDALLAATREKMVRRHPHVFGRKRAGTPRTAYRQWHASKRLEGPRRHSPSKAFRDTLVARWDELYRSGTTASGWSTPPSARPATARGRSPGRAPGRGRADGGTGTPTHSFRNRTRHRR